MKTYIVEDKIINLKTKETMIYYTGKDGYVHDFIEFVDGYKKPSFAQNKINKELETGINMVKLDDNHGLENDRWLHIYTIVEYMVAE